MSKMTLGVITSVVVKYRLIDEIIVDILFEEAGEQHVTEASLTPDEMLQLASLIGCSCSFEKFTIYRLRLDRNPLFIPAPTAQINPNSKQSE